MKNNMQFSKIRGGGYFLANSKNFQLNKSKKSAFSLIELSIVLIIIGLLVAGVTGGASLIESAKIRTVMNELMEYKRAIYTFRVAKERLPGDLNGSGKIGYESGQEYDDSSFSGNYVASNINYGVPDSRSAPYVDMYLEKVIDFEPKKTFAKSGVLGYTNGGVPISKISSNYFFIDYVFGDGSDNITIKKAVLGAKTGNYLRWHTIKSDGKSKFYKTIDLKLDDGIYNSGIIRGDCRIGQTNVDYDDVELCRSLYYPIDM